MVVVFAAQLAFALQRRAFVKVSFNVLQCAARMSRTYLQQLHQCAADSTRDGKAVCSPHAPLLHQGHSSALGLGRKPDKFKNKGNDAYLD